MTVGRAYAGKTADERDTERRLRLREAALDSIGSRGYLETTIPRVCAAAKVSTRHYYALYSTKEDLFVDLYDAFTADSYARVVESLARTAGGTLERRISEALLAYVHPMLSDKRVARVAFVEIVGASPRIENVRLGYRETLITLVTAEAEAAVERGEAEPTNWHFAAVALLGAVAAAAYDWVQQPRGVSRREFEEMLSALASGILMGPMG